MERRKLASRITCVLCGDYPEDSMVTTSCYHCYCRECIEVLCEEAAGNGLDPTLGKECGVAIQEYKEMNQFLDELERVPRVVKKQQKPSLKLRVKVGAHNISLDRARLSSNQLRAMALKSSQILSSRDLPVNLDLTEMSSNQLRAMALESSQILSSRNQHLPRELSYQEWNPSLLRLAPELLDRIRFFYDPKYQYGKHEGYSLRLKGGNEEADGRPAKRRRSGYGGNAVPANGARMPEIRLKYTGPLELPSIRLVCRQLHRFFVEDHLIEAPVNVKIDCIGISHEEDILDFAHRVFPTEY